MKFFPFRRTLPAPFLWKLLLAGLLLPSLLWFLLMGITAATLRDVDASARLYALAMPFVTICLPSWYGVLTIWLIAAGGYRACAFDPFWRSDYFDWLAISPWTPRKPLPKGPTHIVWQDALLLAVACLAIWGGHHVFVSTEVGRHMLRQNAPAWKLCLNAVAAFSAAYLSVKCLAFFCRLRPAAYAMVGIMLLAVSFESVLPLAVGMLLCYGVAQVGTWILLRRLYRSNHGLLHPPLECILGDVIRRGDSRVTLLGERPAVAWPHTMLSPVEDKPNIALWEGTTLAVLAGLAIYAICVRISYAEQDLLVLVSAMGAIVAGTVRLIVYMSAALPPISLFGRALTGRWIIPRYDKAFAPCILIAILGAIMFRAFEMTKDPYELSQLQRVCAALFVAVCVWLVLNMKPTLSRHKLLAPARRQPFGRRMADTRPI